MSYTNLTLSMILLMLVTVIGIPAFAVVRGYSPSWILITMVSSFAIELTGFLYCIDFTNAN